MASLSIYTVVSITVGGENLRAVRNTTLTVGDQKDDSKILVADDNTTVTLWAASASPMTSFTTAIIIVDPDNVYADDNAAAKLEIEFQGDGSTAAAFTVRREAPLILTTDDFGADVDNISEVIDTIKAKNTNAADAGDVSVRLILM